MPDTYTFGVDSIPITCHAFNKNCTQIALSPNNNEVQIHQFAGGKWSLIETLSEHGQRVTGIDWAPTSNRIVTCGADRNAYVWTIQSDKKWKPTLVVLRINRAATYVRWSPKENKFAVSSGARMIAVCYFEKENDWWISKQIKKPIRSTVTCLDWHPNNVLVACGSTDFKARVFSAYIKEVDEKPNSTAWGSKMPFGNMMAEFASGGWVHSVSFSANGDRLAYVGHDSSVYIVDAPNSLQLISVKTDFLPFASVTWISDNSVVAAGYDCIPMLYSYTGGSVKFVSKLDDSDNKQQGEKKVSAMARFKNLDAKAASNESVVETVLNSVHQNTITQVGIHSGTKSNCTKFVTSGVDGHLVLWDVKSLESAIAGLRIA
jgi:actin related protein 2/3 complex subunit 1A/1B